jgi:hypothetical protein
MKILQLVALLAMSLCAVSCVAPEKRIREAPFNERPAVIKDLESRGRISKETAGMFYNQWRAEADDARRKQEAFDRWYRSLSPSEQAAYEQTRMQSIAAVYNSMAITNASLMNNTNSFLDRQAYQQRTQAIQAPKYYNHNIQGTIYHR